MSIAGFARKALPFALTALPAFIFLQALRFKLPNAPETQVIFGTLDDWAAQTFGIEGVFNPGGLFSAHVIGGLEVVASILMIAGLFPALRMLGFFGSLLGFGIISGAVFFHLFTPLGVVVGDEPLAQQFAQIQPDGGGLFITACLVWLCTLTLTIMRRDVAYRLMGRRSATA